MEYQVDMTALRKIETKMLEEFIAICKKYNFRYYLIGGTCLGAVRHQGFIPWDDDIDVGMPRKDYEDFLKVAQKELSENIFLQTAETDVNYANNFAKLRDSNTTFLETTVKNFNINHGVFIDIFPLDGCNQTQRFKRKERFYMRGIQCAFYVENSRLSKKILKKVKRIVFGNYRKLRDKRDKLLKQLDYDQSMIIANYCGAWGEKEVMPKEVFGDGVFAKFENMDVIIPEKWDEYLTRLYGEYMVFPPEEKRISHHYCEVIDLSKSYREYIK